MAIDTAEECVGPGLHVLEVEGRLFPDDRVGAAQLFPALFFNADVVLELVVRIVEVDRDVARRGAQGVGVIGDVLSRLGGQVDRRASTPLPA